MHELVKIVCIVFKRLKVEIKTLVLSMFLLQDISHPLPSNLYCFHYLLVMHTPLCLNFSVCACTISSWSSQARTGALNTIWNPWTVLLHDLVLLHINERLNLNGIIVRTTVNSLNVLRSSL